MKLFNTMTGEKTEFIPLQEGKVKMYACGPTVYNYFHIGNARMLVVFDMLRRYMEYRGYEVTFVQNFTDVDDKIIKKANEEGITAKEVAEKYIKEYFTDAEGLGIKHATVHPRATENIDEIIDIVKTLVDGGFAYQVGGDVYFSTLKFKEYGKLSHMPIEDLEAGARIDVNDVKKDPLDFALWKGAKPGEPAWESPWGLGRPGWHIECSAMVRRYLGKTIDIHCGGRDLVFPHHENEIAQSECANGCEFVRYWVHNGFISVDNEKMSKSAGNFFTVRDVAQKYGYQVIRYFLLSAHYRKPINYSVDIIEQSKASLERIHNCEENLRFIAENSPAGEVCDGVRSLCESRKAQFIEAMDDDFNTADGIAAIFELVKDLNLKSSEMSGACAKYAYDALRELTSLMGLEKQNNGGADTAYIEEMIARRTAAKKARDYATADAIRKELSDMGVILEDTSSGTKYKFKE